MFYRIALRDMGRDPGFTGSLADAEKAWSTGLTGYGALADGRKRSGRSQIFEAGDRSKILELQAKSAAAKSARQQMAGAPDEALAYQVVQTAAQFAERIAARQKGS